MFHFRKIVLHGPGQHLWSSVPAMHLAAERRPVPYFINTILFFMELIIAQFALDPQQNEHGAGHPDRQAHDIDKGKAPVLPEIAERYFQIILEHGYTIGL